MIEPGPALEDRLAQREPPYKSKGEAQVGRLLDRYGIPFFYEHALLVYSRGRYRVWHPDFTLPRYTGLIIEYAGMPDRPDYMGGIRYKERVYKANRKPVLFLNPRHITGRQWPRKVIGRIRRAYRRCTAGPAYSRATGYRGR